MNLRLLAIVAAGILTVSVVALGFREFQEDNILEPRCPDCKPIWGEEVALDDAKRMIENSSNPFPLLVPSFTAGLKLSYVNAENWTLEDGFRGVSVALIYAETGKKPVTFDDFRNMRFLGVGESSNYYGSADAALERDLSRYGNETTVMTIAGHRAMYNGFLLLIYSDEALYSLQTSESSAILKIAESLFG